MKIKELRKICHGDPKRDSIEAKISQKPFSMYLTWLFVKTNIRAEQVCFLWIVSSFIGGVLYFFGNYWLSLLGLAFFHLGMILDCSDGEVARYRKKCTIRGPYLDLVGHTIVNPTILLGAGIYSYKNPMLGISPVIFLILGSIAAIIIVNANVARLKVYEVLLDNKKRITSERKRFKSLPKTNLKGVMNTLIRIGPLSLIYFFTIANLLPIYLLIITPTYIVFYLGRIFHEYNHIKKKYDS